jgi:two-component system OmpR family sensor kinase
MLLLVTAGLLAAGIVTHRALRSFLIDRVDQQLFVASAQARRVMTAPPSFIPREQPPDGGALFPAGTYSAVLDADGDVLDEFVFGFDQDVPSPPDLPDQLPGTTAEQEAGVTFEVASEGEDAEYRVLATQIKDETVVVAIPLTDVQETLGHLVTIELIVSAVVLLGLAGLAWWLVRLGFRPLERMGETAGAIAAGDLSRRVEPTDRRTEVGKLGLALNTMLSRIEEAFAERRASEERLRRFVADASHELRTPLTSVRGYAELFRRGAADDPQLLAKAMIRIEQESARMGELVDELSLLARLDQGRPLERQQVDLVEIAAAAVDAAHVAAPSRRFDLEAPEHAVAFADGVRIRQIFDNLLSNAIDHTPADSPVRVRVDATAEGAALEVEDQGPGIAEDDAERVFERFYRADPSRSRESGGSGLGLSIVAALAEAHGGAATCTQGKAGGARFRVLIPWSDGLATDVMAAAATTGVPPGQEP